jgi:hypothetical protein
MQPFNIAILGNFDRPHPLIAAFVKAAGRTNKNNRV